MSVFAHLTQLHTYDLVYLYVYVCLCIYIYIYRERYLSSEKSVLISALSTYLPTYLPIHTGDFPEDRSPHKECHEPTPDPECAFVRLCTEPRVSPSHTPSLEGLEVAWPFLMEATKLEESRGRIPTHVVHKAWPSTAEPHSQIFPLCLKPQCAPESG